LRLALTAMQVFLGPGSDTGEIQFRIVKGDYESYDQSNDYSCMATAKDFTANPNITAYVNSVLVYGNPPVDEEEEIEIVYGNLNGDGRVNSTRFASDEKRIIREIDKFNVPDEKCRLKSGRKNKLFRLYDT